MEEWEREREQNFRLHFVHSLLFSTFTNSRSSSRHSQCSRAKKIFCFFPPRGFTFAFLFAFCVHKSINARGVIMPQPSARIYDKYFVFLLVERRGERCKFLLCVFLFSHLVRSGTYELFCLSSHHDHEANNRIGYAWCRQRAGIERMPSWFCFSFFSCIFSGQILEYTLNLSRNSNSNEEIMPHTSLAPHTHIHNHRSDTKKLIPIPLCTQSLSLLHFYLLFSARAYVWWAHSERIG